MRTAAGRAMAGRLSWGLADQAVSSLTNFAVGICVARSLGVVAFGIFSLAWVTYSVVLNVSRGLATDPLMVRFSGDCSAAWRSAVGRASGTALATGLVAGGLCLLAGLALGGPLGAAFVALGVVLPALLLQDSWRYAFFAAGQGRRAFVNDTVWAAALVPAMMFAGQRGGVVDFVLAWGLSGAVAAGYGCVQLGMLPRLAGARGWLRQQVDLGPRYLVENVAYSGAAQLRMYGLGAIAGVADVGAVRGADLLLGPYVAVLMGLSLVAVAEAGRVLRDSPHRLRRFCLLMGGGQAAGVLLWGTALLLLMSEQLGRLVLGSVWESASVLLLPATLAMVGVGFYNGAAAGLRALGAARRSMRAQLISCGSYVVCGLAGAAVAGAVGSAWGVAGATLFGAAVWWIQLNRAVLVLDAVLDRHESEPAMTHAAAPRLSIGLPVYNGENYLAEALDSLLGQSYRDFELIISDNASTDRTAEICRRYAAADPRIRYIRQPHNIGAAPNHNFVVTQARGELFKWASHDDLYGRDLLARCVRALDEHPQAVLSHADMAVVDPAGRIVETYDYTLATGSPHAPERFHSLLVTDGGDDFYGVIRSAVLRRVAPHDSYHNAGRKLVAELALHGPFHQVRELLFFRRDHPGRGDRNPTIRAVCANLDPRRARHSTARLLAGYVRGYFTAIRRAPLSAADRRRCRRLLVRWLAGRLAVAPVVAPSSPAGRRPLVAAAEAAPRRAS